MITAKKKKKKKNRKVEKLPVIGWREWASLPALGVKRIKIKIDTGARTSALHATNVKVVQRGRSKFVEYIVHPNQDKSRPAIKCRSRLIEYRKVKSSTGSITDRPVINADVVIGGQRWTTEVTLVNRDMMGFRMLLGRQALSRRFLVNPGKSYILCKSKT